MDNFTDKIFKHGQKIKVIRGKGQIKPGSVGRISYIGGFGHRTYFSITFRIVFTRFGNGGRERIDLLPLKVDGMDFERLGMDLETIDTINKLLMENVPKRYIRPVDLKRPVARIEPLEEESKNLLSIPTFDFLSYIASIGFSIQKENIHYRSHIKDNMLLNKEFNVVINKTSRRRQIIAIEEGIKPHNISELIFKAYDSRQHKEVMDYIREFLIWYFDDMDKRMHWLKILRKSMSEIRFDTRFSYVRDSYNAQLETLIKVLSIHTDKSILRTLIKAGLEKI